MDEVGAWEGVPNMDSRTLQLSNSRTLRVVLPSQPMLRTMPRTWLERLWGCSELESSRGLEFEAELSRPLNPSRTCQALIEGRFTSMDVNPKMALKFACTEYARDTMYGCLTLSQMLVMMVSKCQGDRMVFYLKESETAKHFETGMRLQSGWTPPPAKGKGKGKVMVKPELPMPLRHEENLPPSMIGRSLSGLPLEVLWSFVTATGSFELDLISSHQRCILQRWGVARFPKIQEMLADVKGFRQKNASLMGVSYDTCKQLLQVMTYGGNVEKWLDYHKVSVFPDDLVDLLRELDAARKLDAQAFPQGVAHAKELGRERPAVTSHSWANEITERTLTDAVARVVESMGGNWAMPRGDGGIVQNVTSTKVLAACRAKNLPVDVKLMPKDWDELLTFVRARCMQKGLPEPSFNLICTPEELLAVEAARAELHRDREARDDISIARALLPFVTKFFCETVATDESKEGVASPALEWYDSSERRWHCRGGEERLKFLIESVMKSFFKDFEFRLVMVGIHGDQRMKLVPQQVKKTGICGHFDFVSKLATIVRALMRTMDRFRDSPLNSKSLHTLHYKCGTTLDLSPARDSKGCWRAKPLGEQLRPGTPEDRNSKSTGQYWTACDPALATEIEEICKLFVDACERWGQFSIHFDDDESDFVMAEWAGFFRSKLEALMPKSVILQYFHGAHKEFDSVFYELMFWCRAFSGCQNYEEFLYVYGKFGSNSKGSRIKLLLLALGDSAKNGYLGFQSSAFFQKNDTEANKPDEATAAAGGARLIICDEMGSNKTNEGAKSMPLNAAVVKKWTDIAGTPMPFQRKYGVQETMTVTWAMIFFGNVIPDMKNADMAFKRRPSLMEITTRFVSDKDYNPNDKTHSLVNTNFKSVDFLVTMLPELMHWIRCIVPALYTEKATHSLRIQPVPASISFMTTSELALDDNKDEAQVSLQLVTEFLEQCMDAYIPAGRGKRNVARPAIPAIPFVNGAFETWAGNAGCSTKFGEVVLCLGVVRGNYGGVGCYKNDKGHPMFFKANRPLQRPSVNLVFCLSEWS